MNILLLVFTHLLVFLYASALFISASSDPYPALVTLRSRPTPPSRAAHHHPIPPDVEHDLLPFVLISTIDGALHAVNREGGKIRWTLRDGVEPLVGGGVRGKGNEEEYIVEPLSGGLYVFENDSEARRPQAAKVRKLPLSVEQLIELSPFTFPHSPSRIFTGSKRTSLLTLDLRTGQQLDCYASSAANFSELYEDDECLSEKEQLLRKLEGHGRSDSDTLLVGRTDYRLTIHSPATTSGALTSSLSSVSSNDGWAAPGVQEIAYSTYTPNSYDRPLAEFWAKAGLAEQMWDETGVAKRVRVELGHDGVAVSVERGGGFKWMTDLGSIGIAVYDILLPLSSDSSKPILVPQPPPHVPSLFPVPVKSSRAHLDLLNKPPTTYIGAVPLSLSSLATISEIADDENSSLSPSHTHEGSEDARPKSPRLKPLLYALSSTSYPLINFAPPPRPGSLTNRSFLLSEDLPERDQLLPYLLDPPAEEKGMTPVPNPGSIRFREKPDPGRKWLWWVVAVLGGLVVCGLGAAGSARRQASRQHHSSSTEKIPLLAVQNDVLRGEKSVTIVEPVPASTADTASAIMPTFTEDELTPIPKKKSSRRRIRGKKKFRGSDAAVYENEAEEDDRGEGGSSPPSSVSRKGDKPLPELPRVMSSIGLLDMDEKEKLVISDTVIGFGSHGTVVLKGSWGGRPVAVKRLLSDFTRLASQEVKLLQASDDHPNVIRYYCQERRDNFLYIALDLCQASLADLIESPAKHIELASVLDRKKALAQVSAGLKHLHGMKIIHRDIKPQNVLVSQSKDGSLRMLVSDFGLARRLEQDQSSFAPTANNLAGSLGWRAPECIRGQVRLNDVFDRTSSSSSSSTSSTSSLIDLAVEAEDKDSCGHKHARLTKAVDLFALGCLYFWVLMSGEHPFGEVYDRESNIVKGEAVNMGQLDILGEEGWEAKDLIGRLLSMDPTDRPETSECMIHPFFWTPAKRLAFLCDASDRFEIMELDPPECTLVVLETDATSVVGRDWYSRLDKVFTNNLGKYRKYKGNSVRDLLRAMRNKKHHYQDLEPLVKRHLGALPAGFLRYFTSRYPTLFLHVHGVVRDSRLRHESMFEGYFHEGS